MARNSGPTSTWEERATTALVKQRAYLRLGGDGFVHFSAEGPADYELVEDVGDGFWHMTAAPGAEPTARLFAVAGFIHMVG